MIESSTTRRRGTAASSAVELHVLAATVTEKLTAMEDLSRERSAASQSLTTKVENIDTKVNGLVTDMAVLKTQHAAFWKGATVIFAVFTALGSVAGFVISEVVQWMHH